MNFQRGLTEAGTCCQHRTPLAFTMGQPQLSVPGFSPLLGESFERQNSCPCGVEEFKRELLGPLQSCI